MVITLGSMVVGFILGLVFGGGIGFVMAAIGASKSSGMHLLQWVSVAGGLGVGAVFCYLYIRWLLSARLGNFRLVLVADDTVANGFQPTVSTSFRA